MENTDKLRFDVPNKVAFIAMPFGTRNTHIVKENVPKNIDFDLIWKNALQPVLESLGYIAIRADEQGGSVIVKDMLEMLVYADLVIVDISLPNANVYYEAGIRHVAKQTGCVLIGTEWAQPVFDLDQIRQVRYPYPQTKPDKNTISEIKTNLQKGIQYLGNKNSPIYELTEYPNQLNAPNSTAFRETYQQYTNFRLLLSEVRAQ